MTRTSKPKNSNGLKRTTPANGNGKPRRKPGPKREFSEEQLNDVIELVGKMGARTKELALYFNVSISTVEYWLANFNDFRRAYDKGRVQIGLKVARALVHRAQGYSHPAIHFYTKMVKEYDEEGRVIREYSEPGAVPYTKHYPPDANAGYKFLQVMFPEMWTDVQKIQHSHTGEIQHKHVNEIEVEELSERAQEYLFEVGMKQLGDGTTNN